MIFTFLDACFVTPTSDVVSSDSLGRRPQPEQVCFLVLSQIMLKSTLLELPSMPVPKLCQCDYLKSL